MAKLDNKIFVITKIREKKDILFGQFTDTLTKEKKVEEWMKICQYCKALGLVPKEKDFTYVRDVFWSNIKRATLAKKDNANKIGTPGGKSKKITPLDEIVLEIIYKDTPTPESIVLPDMMLNSSSEYVNITIKEEPTSSNELDNTPEDNTKNQNTRQVNNKTKMYNRFVTSKSKSHEEKDELAIKKRKAELQLEFLALQNYKMKLDIYEMELRLNISHSQFTRDIVRQNDGYPCV